MAVAEDAAPQAAAATLEHRHHHHLQDQTLARPSFPGALERQASHLEETVQDKEEHVRVSNM